MFFTSPRLASLATQTDVLVSRHMATGAGAGQQQQQPGEVLEVRGRGQGLAGLVVAVPREKPARRGPDPGHACRLLALQHL